MIRSSGPKLLALLLVGTGLVLGGCGTDSETESESAGDSIAAAAPATDILLAPLNLGDEVGIGELQPMTRHEGYDNQPSFTPDGSRLLWTSIRGVQSDIYSVSSGSQSDSAAQVTSTPQSEYSPTPRSGGGLSVVRVEDDGRQRLWHYSMNGEPIEPIFPEADSIGYHAWLDGEHVAAFVLGSPPTLRLYSVSTGRDTVIADRIGRSLQPVPGRDAVSFVRVHEDSTTSIHLLEGDDMALQTRRLADTPGTGRSVDHAWAPDGTLFMGDGGSLWAWRTEEDGWTSVASFGDRTFTRLAVSPAGDRLAIVEEK